MQDKYLKIPIEMSEFALREHKTTEVGVYLSSQFLFSGKARDCDRPTKSIAHLYKVHEDTVYRSFKWLLNRNWIGKDTNTGWYFFRGIERVHLIENWRFAKATILKEKDLKTLKAFFAGSVLTGLVLTKSQGVQTEQNRRYANNTKRSKPLHSPVSLKAIQKTLDVSKSTAYRLRKLAKDKKYIDSKPNFLEIKNLSHEDLALMRSLGLRSVSVQLFGIPGQRVIAVKKIKRKGDHVLLQEPNLIYPLLNHKSRKGLSKYMP